MIITYRHLNNYSFRGSKNIYCSRKESKYFYVHEIFYLFISILYNIPIDPICVFASVIMIVKARARVLYFYIQAKYKYELFKNIINFILFYYFLNVIIKNITNYSKIYLILINYIYIYLKNVNTKIIQKMII